MSWDAIICDCDGVLVDSERMANRIFAEMLTALGLPMTVEEAMTQFMGWSMRTCLELMAERLGQPAPEGFVQQIQERTVAAFDRELELVPGVVELLD